MPFLTMRHGFLTRGDISDPDVAAEVQKIHKSGKLLKKKKCDFTLYTVYSTV